jgi:hypothetical protein
MYGESSVVTWLGVIVGVLLVLALGLFAAPLFAVVFVLLVGAAAVAVIALRRARGVPAEPGTRRGPGLTEEGRRTPPTGKPSGAPVSGE